MRITLVGCQRSAFTSALSGQEIKGLTSKEPAGAPPFAHWSLRPPEDGKSIHDRTRHGHDGSLEHRDSADKARMAASLAKDASVGAHSGSEKERSEPKTPAKDGRERQAGELTRNERNTAAEADDPESILRKHGLKANGFLYVPESEAEVQKKATEALYLAGRLKFDELQREQMTPAKRQQTIEWLKVRIGDLEQTIQETDQNMAAFPKFRGRFYSSDAEQAHANLAAAKEGLQGELTLCRNTLNELNRQPVNGQLKPRAASTIRDDQVAYDKALRQFREHVDATNRKISELSKNDEIKSALEARGKNVKVKPTLGSSPEYVKNVRELEKLEKVRTRARRKG